MKRFLIVLALVGCAERPVIYENRIHADFRPLVAEFRLYYQGEWPKGMVIEYGEPTHGKYADCVGIGSMEIQKTITVKNDEWDVLKKEQRFGLISHEFGHCVLGIGSDHTSNQMSYMFPAMRTELFYTENKEALIAELLSNKVSQKPLTKRSSYELPNYNDGSFCNSGLY